jgi:hypothetical protein
MVQPGPDLRRRYEVCLHPIIWAPRSGRGAARRQAEPSDSVRSTPLALIVVSLLVDDAEPWIFAAGFLNVMNVIVFSQSNRTKKQ